MGEADSGNGGCAIGTNLDAPVREHLDVVTEDRIQKRLPAVEPESARIAFDAVEADAADAPVGGDGDAFGERPGLALPAEGDVVDRAVGGERARCLRPPALEVLQVEPRDGHFDDPAIRLDQRHAGITKLQVEQPDMPAGPLFRSGVHRFGAFGSGQQADERHAVDGKGPVGGAFDAHIQAADDQPIDNDTALEQRARVIGEAQFDQLCRLRGADTELDRPDPHLARPDVDFERLDAGGVDAKRLEFVGQQRPHNVARHVDERQGDERTDGDDDSNNVQPAASLHGRCRGFRFGGAAVGGFGFRGHSRLLVRSFAPPRRPNGVSTANEGDDCGILMASPPRTGC